MRRQVFILLFPHNKFMDMDVKKQVEFNRCIKRRYLDNGYELIVINYWGSDAKRIIVPPTKIEFSDKTFFDCTANGEYPDFGKLARSVNPTEYDKIVIGGFHCFDCVEKFANEVYSLNKNVVVDGDLTERFDYLSNQEAWDEEVYNPDIQLEQIREHFKDNPTLLLKRFKNPIWGISNSLLDDIKHCEEESKHN